MMPLLIYEQLHKQELYMPQLADSIAGIGDIIK